MAAPKKAVGPKSDKLWRQAIMLAVNRVSQDGKTKHLDILAHRLIKSAAEGDISALREVGDRLDGKPVAVQELTGADGGAIKVEDASGKKVLGAAMALVKAAARSKPPET